jgi:hypothetical protein
MRYPAFKKRPEGFLVYLGSELLTPQLVDGERVKAMEEAAEIAGLRVEVFGVHKYRRDTLLT